MTLYTNHPESPSFRLRIADMPSDDRPRERLLAYGPEVLSTAELLAILLRTGTAQENVIRLAERLLSLYGGLSGLMTLSAQELSRIKGLGPAKSSELKAVLELCRRLQLEEFGQRPVIQTIDDAADFAATRLRFLDHEELHVMSLNQKLQVMEYEVLYKGTVNGSLVRVAEVFRTAITRQCTHVCVFHNHPSGNPEPSPEDLAVTRHLLMAANLLDIHLIDHLIIGARDYTSIFAHLRELGEDMSH